MFEVTNYNLFILFYAFIISFFILFFLFKNRLVALIDPLCYHLVWVSSHIAFFVGFSIKYGFSIVLLYFIEILALYIIFLYIFIKKVRKNNLITYNTNELSISYSKLFELYVVAFLLILISKINCIKYILTHSLVEWPLYRFIDLQGRDIILRVVNLGAEPIFYFLAFYILFFKSYNKILRLIVGLSLTLILALNIISGGRSSLLGLVFSFGSFIYFYRMSFNKKLLSKINLFGILLVTIGLLIASFISYFYVYDFNRNLADGFYIIFNRIFANADGIEYYLIYDGYDKIDSGIIHFIFSFLGIYLKRIIGFEYKNVGHQLTELVVGPVDFAQGSNYTIFLQSAVIGHFVGPLYVICVAYLISKMRNLKPSKTLPINLFKSFFVLNMFTIAGDLEYFTLKLISFTIVYFLIFYPISKVKIIFNSRRNYRNENFGLYGNIQ